MDREKLDRLSLFNVPFLFSCSKRTSYRTGILLRARATAEVFTEQSIAKTDLLARYTTAPEEFNVVFGDLTDEGVEFTRINYQRWLSNSDRWKGEFTYDKFKTTLLRQWNKFKKESNGLS